MKYCPYNVNIVQQNQDVYEYNEYMTEEERKKFNRLVEVVEDLTAKIDNLQKQNKQNPHKH